MITFIRDKGNRKESLSFEDFRDFINYCEDELCITVIFEPEEEEVYDEGGRKDL